MLRQVDTIANRTVHMFSGVNQYSYVSKFSFDMAIDFAFVPFILSV
jgi:hypothetical protein